MKVLCIKSSDDVAYTKRGPMPTPENMKIFCGDFYTVVEEVVGYKDEKKWVLEERPKNCRYRKLHFAPLSEENEEASAEIQILELTK